jgi:hypothetical protein
VSKRSLAPFAACLALAAPASASAHATSPTVALDYRLVLDRATRSLPGASVDILDGDRSLRLRVRRGNVTVLGDLGEPMLRIGPAGTWINRGSVTANAQRLVTQGRGWKHVAGSSFVWHDHRLGPPPYGDGRPGPAARFTIPIRVDGRPAELGGTFVRYRRPLIWPWLAGAGLAAVAVAAALRARPRDRSPLTLGLGTVAAVAALTGLVGFGAADAPNGRVAWAQIVLGCALAVAVAAALLRLQRERRTLLAGLVGAAAAVASIGSLAVFRHAVVISLLPAAASRAVSALGLTAGIAAAATVLLTNEARP